MDRDEDKDASPPAIVVEDLGKSFNDHEVLRGIDLKGHHSAIASSDGIVVGEYVHRPSGMGEVPDVPIPAGHLAGVDRHGITWTFDRPARCGRYVNGDWWVLGPISITSIKELRQRSGGGQPTLLVRD